MEELIPNFRDQNVQGAVKNLLTYSIVILLVPLGSMFLVKQVLQGIYHICLLPDTNLII